MELSSCNNISNVIWEFTFNSLEHMNHWLKKRYNEWQYHFKCDTGMGSTLSKQMIKYE